MPCGYLLVLVLLHKQNPRCGSPSIISINLQKMPLPQTGYSAFVVLLLHDTHNAVGIRHTLSRPPIVVAGCTADDAISTLFSEHLPFATRCRVDRQVMHAEGVRLGESLGRVAAKRHHFSRTTYEVSYVECLNRKIRGILQSLRQAVVVDNCGYADSGVV